MSLVPAEISSLGSLLDPEPDPLQTSVWKADCTRSEVVFSPMTSLCLSPPWHCGSRVALWTIFLLDWTLWRLGCVFFSLAPGPSVEPSLINKWIDFLCQQIFPWLLTLPKAAGSGMAYPGLPLINIPILRLWGVTPSSTVWVSSYNRDYYRSSNLSILILIKHLF